jgi:hypothetical protein
MSIVSTGGAAGELQMPAVPPWRHIFPPVLKAEPGFYDKLRRRSGATRGSQCPFFYAQALLIAEAVG